MNPIVSVVGDNPRMAGIGDLGCSGNRECAPCAAKRAGTTLQGLGYVGLGAQPAPENRDAARSALLAYASYLLDGAAAAGSRDPASAYNSLADLQNTPDLSNLGDPSLQEIAASKQEALAALRDAADGAAHNLPSQAGSYGYVSDIDLAGFARIAHDVGVRLHARALSTDFDKPAVLNAADQAAVNADERVWAQKVAEDQRLANLQQCSARGLLLDNSITTEEFLKRCTPIPGGLDFGKIVLLGLGVLALTFVAGRAS